MRICCFGKDGLLSTELQEWLPELNPLSLNFLSKSDCDITDKDAVNQAFNTYRPTHVINAAAYTKVDDCETDASTANLVNGFALDHLIDACNQYGATLIHFSTDYVFNGTKETPYEEDDLPIPINSYGASKLIAETAIRARLIEHYILRVQWVYGPAKPNFVSTILRLAKEKKDVHIVNDQFGSPTSTTSISKAVVNLILNKPEYGTYHFRTLKHTSWYDFAVYFLEKCKMNVAVIPVSSSEFKTKAKRPKNGVLNIGKWIYSDLYTPPTWENDVLNYLKKEKLI